jgi:hypothetical protein
MCLHAATTDRQVNPLNPADEPGTRHRRLNLTTRAVGANLCQSGSEDRDSLMQSAKEQAVEVLRRLPDDVSMEDIQYHLYVQEKIRKGQESIAAGRSLDAGQAKERLGRWLEK